MEREVIFLFVSLPEDGLLLSNLLSLRGGICQLTWHTNYLLLLGKVVMNGMTMKNSIGLQKVLVSAKNVEASQRPSSGSVVLVTRTANRVASV